MSSQANVLIRDKGEKSSLAIRLLHDGPVALQEFVFNPLHHAKIIRTLRPQSVVTIKSKYQINLPLGDTQAKRMALHHFDEKGHLFGIGVEYFANVLLMINMFNAVPLAKQRNAWGNDDKPVAIVDANMDHQISYALGPNSDYPYLRDTDYMEVVRDNVQSFNELMAHGTIKADPDVLITQKNQGFTCQHNILVLHILLNDLDLVWESNAG
jgi:hypothetical protein